MKLITSIAAAIAFAAAAPAFAAAPTAPVTLEAKNGNVTFNHKSHAAVTCTKCHENAAGGKIESIKNKDKAHGLCVDCHKTEAKGPTKCAECHKKG